VLALSDGRSRNWGVRSSSLFRRYLFKSIARAGTSAMWSGSAQVRLVFSAGVENANSFSASAARSFGQILAQYTTSPLTPPFHLAKRLVLCDSRDRTIWLTKRPALGSRCAPLFQLRLNRERDRFCPWPSHFQRINSPGCGA
jgi:hypothetical protein